jgi:hypothetical protein
MPFHFTFLKKTSFFQTFFTGSGKGSAEPLEESSAAATAKPLTQSIPRAASKRVEAAPADDALDRRRRLDAGEEGRRALRHTGVDESIGEKEITPGDEWVSGG